tara:strand:- start:21214 stop:21711 length:498 start_codon:yes stop_codon:yes gene_type:complete
MILNRTDLTNTNTSFVRGASFNSFSMEGLRPARKNIRVELSVTESNTGFNIKGIVEAGLIETCDRCISDFKQTHSIPFNIILTRKKEFITPDKEEEIYYFPDNQNEFNIVPILRDAIFLERTMKHLCKKSCQGLCTHCGANLNETQCDCKKNVIDERWAPLLNLK